MVGQFVGLGRVKSARFLLSCHAENVCVVGGGGYESRGRYVKGGESFERGRGFFLVVATTTNHGPSSVGSMNYSLGSTVVSSSKK